MTPPALVYDGECPFCGDYLELLKLRERWPDLQLIDAREKPQHLAVERVRSAGLRIDDGMALIDGEIIYHGADAIHAVAKFGGVLNRIAFGSKSGARMLYPLLKTGRALTLKALGRPKIGF
jgi:predicted DCC family thiol-disulfide oxidoreductase YuxK